MTEEELMNYLINSILPLYLDAKDEPAYGVMLKVDSGPGRNFLQLLAIFSFCGFYMYPGVPNSTSVLQEVDLA